MCHLSSVPMSEYPSVLSEPWETCDIELSAKIFQRSIQDPHKLL